MAIKVFLGSGDSFTASNNNISVVGASGTGSETIVLQAGVTGVTTDANIERVDVSGNLADFKFVAVAGTGIQIQNAAGTVVATIPSLNQNATVAFTDGSATLVQTGGTAFTLGGQAVSTTTAAAITSASMGTGFNTSVKSTSGTTSGGTTTIGQSFSLTNNSTADSLVLTTGNDTVTGAAGTMATGDIIVDPSTTDADTANLTVNSYAAGGVRPTISNVETVNVIGAFTATGLDLANVSGTKSLNFSAGIAGGTATADAVTSTNVSTGIVAGSNIGALNINTTAFTSGTSGNVNVDRGSATTATIGNTGNTGSDTFTVSSIANGTTALLGGSSGTDTFTVNLVGGASTLSITNNAAAVGDINALNLNSNTSANTITLGTSHDLAGNSSGDRVQVGGNQALTIVGNGDAIANTAATTSVLFTKASGAGTVTFANNVAMTGGQVFINRSAVDVFEVRTDPGLNLTVNENTTVKQVGALGSRTWDVGNTSTAGTIAAGVGTLKFDLAGSSSTNATVTSITTGAAVGTLVLTNNTIDSIITTLDTATTATSTGNTVVVTGTKNLTISTLTMDASETLVATGLSGNLVVGGTAVTSAATIIGGSGNDTITGSGSADSLVGGSGNDVINGGVAADTITGGLGNDRIVEANSATIDTITDFSISGTNGIDVIAFSFAGTNITGTLAAPQDGNSVATSAGTTAKVLHAAAATTGAVGDNIFVIDGTFASSAILETAIESGGSRQLTFASAHTANDDILVVWTDGTNGHFGFYNDAVGATTLGATGTYTELLTLTGVTDVTTMASANFLFVA